MFQPSGARLLVFGWGVDGWTTLCQVGGGAWTQEIWGGGERSSWPERSEFPDPPAGDWWQWSTVHLGPLPERHPDIFSPAGPGDLRDWG